MSKDWETICHELITLVKRTGHYVREASKDFHRGNEDAKAPNSFVTEIDLGSERLLVEGLAHIIPDAGFITEENTVPNETKPMCWIVDPIDGTTNFIHGVPAYAISVGLLVEDHIQVGVVHEITRNECFYAIEGGGAYCNGKPIHVSGCQQFEDGLYATGFPYDTEDTPAHLRILETFLRQTRGFRRLGSAAVDLAYVACGRFDGFYEHRLNAWDVSAGSLIVQEAGGHVSDFQGGSEYIFGGEIVASTPAVHHRMCEIISKGWQPD